MLESQTIDKLKSNSLLLDTNVLIDSFRYPDLYQPLLKNFINSNVILTTIHPVLIELYKGSDTISHLEDKKNHFDQYISHIIPLDKKIIENTSIITTAYRKYSKDISATDLYLAGTLKRYEDKLYLMTRNHKDFPTSLFDRVGVINIEH